MSAYSDLMNRGVIGANNNSGVWAIQHNGNQIDLDSLPRK
jgi:hypothetical protein